MANSDNSIWRKLESAAFIVTVGAGILSGIFWILGGTDAGDSDFVLSAGNFFVIVAAVGGVTMGLLYLRRRLTQASN